MPSRTPTSKDAKQALYAVAGAADLAVSSIRHLPAEAAKLRDRLPSEATRTYGQLVPAAFTDERVVAVLRRTRVLAALVRETAVWVASVAWRVGRERRTPVTRLSPRRTSWP